MCNHIYKSFYKQLKFNLIETYKYPLMKKIIMKKEVLTEFEAEKLLKSYLPIAKNQLLHSLKELKIKPPLVLKIISKQALHKTDIGGVRIVKSKSEVESTYNDLIRISKRKKLKLQGILAQEYHDGHQIIIGIKKDPVFDHVILLGYGGIFVEIIKDISIRACPITIKDAESMIQDLKSKEILYGKRGKKANINLLIKLLVKTSKIPLKYKNLLELDINPLILNEKTAHVVDARMVLER